jgi:Cyclopropane fatty acid synthase and related methyltransferases
MDNNQEIKNIHEFDFDMICDYFSSTLRQGPGGDEQTLQALKAIGNLSGVEKIADIGCGTGSSTLILAQNTTAKITAIDLFPTFLTKLQNRVKEGGINPERVQTQVADMRCLDFKNEEFDVIWSEGAIYNIGFKRGIEEWKKYLKKRRFPCRDRRLLAHRRAPR